MSRVNDVPRANDVRRTKLPASKLILATECGGSDGMSGITKQPTYIGYLDHGDWVKYTAVDFGSGATSASINVAVAPAYAGRQIQLRLGSPTGPPIGALTVAATGGWSTFVTQTTPVSGASGVHDLYLVFTGGDGVGSEGSAATALAAHLPRSLGQGTRAALTRPCEISPLFSIVTTIYSTLPLT